MRARTEWARDALVIFTLIAVVGLLGTLEVVRGGHASDGTRLLAAGPPGLEKHGQTPPGLDKQGKVPPGWEQGQKRGWPAAPTPPPTASSGADLTGRRGPGLLACRL